MKLSIVMMVKNEEKYLGKTLSSLNPIIESIESEIIVLDTGSTDRTVEIAKKYTDKVYFEKWNDDFSSMRNKSISYAKGEWLLILDADEPVIKYDKLLDFFKTDKHKKYNCATIEICNIMKLNPIKKSIVQIPRFFRNTNEFKYTGIIHEQPQITNPIYNSIITCDHYGYLFQDKNLERKKIKRNIELLEKQLQEQNSNESYIRTHLAICYAQLNNKLYDALYNARKSYELVKKSKINNSQILYYSFQYQTYVKMLVYNNELKKAYDICLEYIKFDNKNIDILYNLSVLSIKLYIPSDCIKYSKQYLYYRENYEESSNYINMYSSYESVDNKDQVYKSIINAYLNLEKFKEAIHIFENNEFDKSLVYFEIINCLYKSKKTINIIDIYESVETDYKKIKLRRAIERNLKLNFRNDDLDNTYKLLSNLDDEYGIFNKYRLDKEYNDNLEQILIEKNELYYYEIIEIYINNSKRLPELLKYMHNEKLETAFIYCIKNSFEFKFVLEDIILNLENTLDINLIRIYKIITKVLLLNGQLFEESYNKIFDLYIMYNRLYNEVINKSQKNNELVLNTSNFEEMFIKELDDLKNLKDNVLYIRKLKNLAIDYPNHKKSIDYLKEKFEKSLNETDEIKILKKQFIDMISNNISKDNTEQIEVLLEQYKELYGIDKEILNIYGILNIYKEDLNSAEINFKNVLALDVCNADALYNIAYLKELKEEFKEAKLFYEFCRDNTDEQDLINICNEKINNIKIGE